jgi:peptidoglycan hydrolase-like protein with peptidoglycan-binding domain
MPIPNRGALRFPPTGNNVEPDALHEALGKLRINVAPDEVAAGEIGATTTEAIREVQKRAGLPEDGTLNARTVDAIRSEVDHVFYTGNRVRTAKVQAMLAQVGENVDRPEVTGRRYDASTAAAIATFQKAHGLADTGRMSDETFDQLERAALYAKFGSKTQVAKLQRRLIHVGKVARLDVQIAPEELKARTFGPTTKAVITAIQEKYGLDTTGALDPATVERIDSVADSRPRRLQVVAAGPADELRPVRRTLRLNMTSEEVGGLQRSLAFLGYKVAQSEFGARRFGGTTRSAVMAFQAARGLPQTGHVDGTTRSAMNASIVFANPAAAAPPAPYRLRGSVRDELWMGRPGLKVQILARTVSGDGPVLAERSTLSNGFYDIPFEPAAGPGMAPHVRVRVLDASGAEIGSKMVFNPTPISWTNFTAGDEPYRGASMFDRQMKAISTVIGNMPIADLREEDAPADPTTEAKQITHVAINAALPPEDVMRLVLAHKVATSINVAELGPAVMFAFIGQNQPANMPGHLIPATEGWTLIDQLVEQTVRGIGFMDPAVTESTLDVAAKSNLVPVSVAAAMPQILASLEGVRQRFALEKPILAGNGSLESILAASAVPAAARGAVASAFLENRGLSNAFWSDLRSRPADFGGEAAVADLETVAQIGQMSRNHGPTVSFLRSVLADQSRPELSTVADTAKLDRAGWIGLINENGGQVPDGFEGTPAERVEAYAAALASQAERLYPTIAVAAEIGRNGATPLANFAATQALLYANPDLDLRAENVDSFFKAAPIDPEVRAEIKAVQRVQRLAPDATTTRSLLEDGVHSAAQIVGRGREAFVKSLTAKAIDERTAHTIYGRAEYQYSQIVARLGDFRREIHQGTPAAVPPQTYTTTELKEVFGDSPDLEALFGPQDYCDCDNCASILGPAAYLADSLRFLSKHESKRADGASVEQIFLDRRPDIGNIKLNCDNAEVPLPYIDLVCEILEGAIPAPATASDFDWQTTKTAGELRAFPENVRGSAYKVLQDADFPIDCAFDLWQEEARIWLQHLGVPRPDLMERFQARPAAGARTPTDTSIAGEQLGLSSHETDLITTADVDTGHLAEVWGFDCTRVTVGVREFLDHARLEYEELLALLQVDWIDGAPQNDGLDIERPAAQCNLDLQSVINLTPERFDRIHRFLRLWRHADLEMWQLDRLIRAPRLGQGAIDAETVARLAQFGRLRSMLGLSFDAALALVGEIDSRPHRDPRDIDRVVEPMFDRLFRNRAVMDPVDPAFAAMPGGQLADHAPALIAGLATTEADLQRLIERTNGVLSIGNLTRLFNDVHLARSLKLSIERLLTLQLLSATADPYASPQATLDFIDAHRWIVSSGLDIDELDYLIRHRPDSPYGLREEAVAQLAAGLREALRGLEGAERESRAIDQVASAFSLPSDQSRLVVTTLRRSGQPLLTHLVDPRITARNPDDTYVNALDAATLGDLFGTLRLLHKVSLLIRRQRIPSTNDVRWLVETGPAFGLLDFGALPVDGPPAGPLYASWLALRHWLDLRERYPEPEGESLRGVFDLAAAVDGAGALATPIADLHAAISRLTRWPIPDVEAVHTGLGLSFAVGTNDYTTVETYIRMDRAMAAVRRLGVSGDLAAAWSRRDGDITPEQTLNAIRAAARSKYDTATWLSTAVPLIDALRERKRDALIRHLIETSLRTESKEVTVNGRTWRNPRYWDEPNDLLRYFLIDVEMGACQLTSRTVQAISSLQMFVQRCFLNVEQPDVEVTETDLSDEVSSDSWRQWRYFKKYRVAEAAKRVLLYPENWILPELRDDKSPFFRELEDELLQSELTPEHTEQAFRHYLEKVHEISRIEVVGVYHEVDDENPWDSLPPTVNVLHVIGRTRTDPSVYYYRTFDLSYGTWSPWGRIDVDIAGDHLIPVVYNRRLYLFWLVFLEKPIKMKKQPPAMASTSTKTQDSPESPKSLEIQLAWTARVEGGWAKRQISREKVVHPWERPRHSYHFKPRYKSRENQLWLDIYVSMSAEFNNGRTYDQFDNVYQYPTRLRFNPAFRAWHSSSFVFDGGVAAVKMKPLDAKYHLPDAFGPFGEDATQTNSYDYVRLDFPAARSVTELAGPYETGPRLPVPDGMRYYGTRLANANSGPTGRVNVLESAATQTVLTGGNAPFELIFSQDHIKFDTAAWGPEPFLYQDAQRSFFVQTRPETYRIGYSGQTVTRMRYRMHPFYHPYTALFLRELDRSGLDRLLTRRIQVSPQAFWPGNNWSFAADYGPGPTTDVDPTAARDIVDFEPYGAFSIYNWETFFHAPLMIACKLSADQRFEEAMRWFHYIFDPTNVEALPTPQRFWVTKPFFERSDDEYRKQRIENLLANLGAEGQQIRAWRNDPFNPHMIARYRPVAYQKTVVMKYIDNLIAWGDQLFGRDTMESINEATTLYVLAYELLGRRPVKVPAAGHVEMSYNELVAEAALDLLGNRSVTAQIENFIPPPTAATSTPPDSQPLPSMEVLYFCIPPNDKLLGYWDTVEDRLFKIRHCMNIQGVVRQLPLFEPPIDPALLVKAAVAGIDIGDVLDGLAAPSSQYRYRTLVAKAAEYCGEVRALGDKLLSALEKRDAEGLALLHSSNEVDLLEATKDVRKQQIADAEEATAGLEQAKILAEKKLDYYRGREFMSPWEITALTLSGISAGIETGIALANILSSGLRFIPRVQVGGSGFGGSPHATADVIDGAKIADSIESGAKVLQSIAAALDKNASLSSTLGGYWRRKDDWDFQAGQAETEITQIDRQIAGATIRQAIAERELENLELQIEQSTAADEYLKTKYTNRQLYDWMVSQLATVYFQAYKLAFDMARRAQRAMQFELGRPDLTFIEFGYWDSLKKGLLSGEKLGNDIHRMEVAYFEQNGRELELTKHVSVAQVDPAALIRLQMTGETDVSLPEWLYDMDRLGDYRRRIKSVSLTIPAVVGPYGGVHATLALTRNGMRVNDSVAAAYGDPLAAGDARFASNPTPVSVIATSSGQNDSGLFELSFADERLLPFEGAGAVSEWHLSLPAESNAFDFSTISDVILHVRYTATQSTTPAHVNAARANLAATLPPAGVRLLDMKSEFASEWYRFLSPGPGVDQVLTLAIGLEHLPFYARSRQITLTGIDLFVASAHAGSFDAVIQVPGVAVAPPSDSVGPDPAYGNVNHLAKAFAVPASLLGTWTIMLKKDAAADFRSLAAEDISDAYVILRFTAT